jgi:aryl-alcohol dehydrogenase-like predicted oxidoreductase
MYFPYSRRDNLGILARVPLASGLLTGKYRPGASFPTNDWRSTFDAGKMRQDLAEVERIRQAEVPAGVPLGQWALAWCLKDPLVSAVIPGCKDVAQVQANASAAELVTPGSQ